MSFGDWIRRAWFWIRRDRLSDELDEEMRLHIELRARANRQCGMSADEADLAARRQFGSRLALREAGRDAWGFLALERVLQDLRYGARQLLRHRGVTAAIVLTLALGIGANTALFTVINAVLLKPAPAVDPDRLVWICGTTARSPELRRLSYADYLMYRERADVFQAVVAFAGIPLSVGGVDGENPERVRGMMVSTNYFDVLGVPARLGRTFTSADVSSSADPAAIIGDGFWQRRYGGVADIVGRTIKLNGRQFVIVGVLPRGFSGLDIPDPSAPAVWVPVETAPLVMSDRPTVLTQPEEWLQVAGRLQPDVSTVGAAAAVATLAMQAPSLSVAHPRPRSATVLPIKGGLDPDERREVAPVLWLLMVVPALVLIVACANVANVLLARGVARRKELSLRRAFGATRSRLVRQLLTENLLVSLIGAMLAMAVSTGFVQVIGTLADVPHPILDAMTPDARVFLGTMAVGAMSVLIFGLSPALSATSSSLVSTLHDEVGAVDARGRRRRLKGAFVVTQVAVSMALLIAAGLFLQSLGRALLIDPGFDPRHVLTFSYDLAHQGAARRNRAELDRALLDRVRATPGVQSAVLAAPLPLSGGMIEEHLQPESADQHNIPVRLSSVSPGYFDTIGLDLVRGRDFSALDALGTPQVAIVNAMLARQLAPEGDAFGKRFRFARPGEPWRTIVGVARDSKSESLMESTRPVVYLPWAQWPAARASVLARLRDEPKTIVPLIVKEVHALDADLPLYDVSMLEQRIGRSMNLHRGAASLLSVFGTLALLLAALGIYGVTAHGVTLRTNEIGIRMSLGARAPQVVGMFVGEGLRLSTIGVVIGLVLSASAANVLEAFLFGLHATDAITFAAVGVLLCSVAMLSSYLPARRAAGIDPLRALRHE